MSVPLADYYREGRRGLSFELFPPKTEAGMRSLFRTVDELVQLEPDFLTCTYGAGGSTRAKTLEIVTEIRRRTGLPTASHLTCVGATVDELREYLGKTAQAGVEYIVALRGDPPRGETNFEPVAGGLRYGNELVALIRSEFPDFGVAVAGYPEVHQEAENAKVDLDNLKRKIDAGADVVITQLFYDNDDFFRFRDRYERAGIRVPLVPGLLPVTNLAQIEKITSLCKARLPDELIAALSADDSPEGQFEAGVDHARRQVAGLLEGGGVPGLHLYVLNKSQAAAEVLRSTWSTATS